MRLCCFGTSSVQSEVLSPSEQEELQRQEVRRSNLNKHYRGVQTNLKYARGASIYANEPLGCNPNTSFPASHSALCNVMPARNRIMGALLCEVRPTTLVNKTM